MPTARESRTAAGVAVMRALESHARTPLFRDPLAEPMLTGWPATMLAHRATRWAFLHTLDRLGPGFYGAVVCRTRVIDDACRTALTDGVRQVVIIGAGMDTRPYRLPEMTRADVWELDLPTVQHTKKEAITRVLGSLPPHVRYTPLDLTTSPPPPPLEPTPTLVLCEAVSMYLPTPAVQNLFTYAGALPPESRFIFTYLPRAVRDDPAHAKWSRRLNWQTAFHPAEVSEHLSHRGLKVLADIGAEHHQEQLLKPLGRSLKVFPGERIVIAAA